MWVAGIVTGVLGAAIGALGGVVSFVWDSILAPAAAFLSGVFAAAVGAASGAWSWLQGAVSAVGDIINSVWTQWLAPIASFLTDTFAAGVDIATAAWDALYGAIESIGGVLSDIKEAAEDTIGVLADVASNIPGAGIISGGLNALGLAAGGIVRHRPGGTIARIGEGGSDEVVIPLDDADRALQLANASGLLGLLGQGGVESRATGASTGGLAVGGGTTIVFEGGLTIQVERGDPTGERRGRMAADAFEATLARRSVRLDARIAGG
jgi:hypothetical protein